MVLDIVGRDFLIRDDISAVSLQHVNLLLASLHSSNLHLDPFMYLLACQVCGIRTVGILIFIQYLLLTMQEIGTPVFDFCLDDEEDTLGKA